MLKFSLGQVNTVMCILMAPSASWKVSGEKEGGFLPGNFFSCDDWWCQLNREQFSAAA